MSSKSEQNLGPAQGLRWPLACTLGLLVLGMGAGFFTLTVDQIAAAAGISLILGAFAIGGGAGILKLQRLYALYRARRMFLNDFAPGFLSDRAGQVLWWNIAARNRYAAPEALSLMAALNDLVADPASLLKRLGTRARQRGTASEDVTTRSGLLRIQAFHFAGSTVMWRLDEYFERGGLSRGVEGMSLPMLVAGQSGTVLYANEALRRITGGRPHSLEHLFAGKVPASGGITTFKAVAGNIQAVVIEIEGIADRREIYLLPLTTLPAIASLHAFEDLPLALLRLGPDGSLLASNFEARAMLNLGTGEQVNASQLFEGPGRQLRDWITDVAAGRAPGKTETLRLLRSNNSDSYVRLTLRPWGGSARNGLLAVVVDATEIRSLEAQQVQSQKMQLVGQLAGGIAHDFNNLLTAISGYCDLIFLRHDATSPDYADLAQIRQNANRAAALVNQLLAFSRKQTLYAEYLSLPDLVSEMSQLLNRLVGERVQLEVEHDQNAGLIRADRRQLEQVLMNLVINARDASEVGSKILISTAEIEFEQPNQIGKVALPAGRYARLSVTDQGPGIAPELMAKIFEPFFTTKALGEGTGLGLSTAYGIVKQSGGFIFAINSPAGGAEFSIYLPLHDGSDAEVFAGTELMALASPGAPGEGVILLVEDEAPVRNFAARALKMRGYTVIDVADGEAALDVLEDSSLDIRLFVSDVIMPGLDGPAWVRKAWEKRPNTGVIFISGYAADSLGVDMEERPEVSFLSKPFSLNALTRTVSARLTV